MDNYTHIFLTQEEAIEDERLLLQAAATAMIIYLGAEESQVLHGNNPIGMYIGEANSIPWEVQHNIFLE